MESEQGKCAKCGSSSIDYRNFLGDRATELKDKSISTFPQVVGTGASLGYHYWCEDCGHEGVEWYIMKYDEST